MRIETNFPSHGELRRHIPGLKRWLGDEFDGKVIDDVTNWGIDIKVEGANFGRLGFPIVKRLRIILDGTAFAEVIATNVMGIEGEVGTVSHFCGMQLDHPVSSKFDGVSVLRIAATKSGFAFGNYDPETADNLRDIYETIQKRLFISGGP